MSPVITFRCKDRIFAPRLTYGIDGEACSPDMCTVVEDAVYHRSRSVPPLEWGRHKRPQNEERNSFPQRVPLKHEREWLKKGNMHNPHAYIRYTVTRPDDKFPYPGWGEANQSLYGAKMFAPIYLHTSLHFATPHLTPQKTKWLITLLCILYIRCTS